MRPPCVWMQSALTEAGMKEPSPAMVPRAFMNHINTICLGVQDMGRSLRFYREGLGFHTSERGGEPRVLSFDSTGTRLELYPLHLLAEDIDANDPPRIASGFSGVTLAYNVRNKEEADEALEEARSAGAGVVKEAQGAFWGGHHAYFSDPRWILSGSGLGPWFLLRRGGRAGSESLNRPSFILGWDCPLARSQDNIYSHTAP